MNGPVRARYGVRGRWGGRSFALVASGLLLPIALQAQEGLSLPEAVRTALERNGRLLLARAALDADEGRLTTANGEFGFRVIGDAAGGRERFPLSELEREQFPGIDLATTDRFSYRLGLARRFRSGMTVNPGVELLRSTLTAGGDTHQVAFPTGNQARLSLLVSQPLLRGRGAQAAASAEAVAALSVNAGRATLRHAASSVAAETLSAYWRYAAAVQVFESLSESEERVRRLLQETETLVAADQRPAADLDQIRADVADRTAARIRGSRDVATARLALGGAMGLEADEAALLPAPADPFPAAGTERLERDPHDLVQTALELRGDLEAARARMEGGRVLREAAHRNRLPALNLDLSLGYAGQAQGGGAERFFSPLYENIGGLNLGLALRYEIPLGDAPADGLLATRIAEHRGAEVAVDDAARRVEIEVRAALVELHAAHETLALSEESLGHHRRALENEQLRFQQGLSTLFNVLLFQDRLTLAEAGRIQAMREYAEAEVQLRHAAGMLIRESGRTLEPELSGLTSPRATGR